MVERFLHTLSAPVRGLQEAAYVLALLTLASQALALLRDRTFAHFFGASETLDLYYSAFRIPDLVFALIASLVSAYVLIPRITGRESGEVRALLSQSVSFLLVAGAVLSLVLWVCMPALLAVLYPAFTDSPQFAELVLLARLLLLQPIILGISGIITSVTQVHRRFTLYALSPVLYNLGIIAGAFLLYPRMGLLGVGVGVIAGACLHAAIHVPMLLEARAFPRLTLPSWSVMRLIVRDSLPRSLALSMGSLTLLALTAYASRIAEGSVSVFTFALNLEAVPLALVGASYAVAAFPALSEHSQNADRDSFARVLLASARSIVLWSFVFLGLVVVLRAHIVRVVLGTGAFDWDATRLTAALLAILVAGLVAQGLVLLFSRALYAVGRSWLPFFYQLVGSIATVALAHVSLAYLPDEALTTLAAYLRVEQVGGVEVLLLAFALVFGQWLLATLSIVALWRTTPHLAHLLMRPLFDGLLAALAGGVATYAALYLEGGVAPLTTFAVVFTEALVAGMVGLAAAAGTLALLKNEEFSAFVNAVRLLPGLARAVPPSAGESPQS